MKWRVRRSAVGLAGTTTAIVISFAMSGQAAADTGSANQMGASTDTASTGSGTPAATAATPSWAQVANPNDEACPLTGPTTGVSGTTVSPVSTGPGPTSPGPTGGGGGGVINITQPAANQPVVAPILTQPNQPIVSPAPAGAGRATASPTGSLPFTGSDTAAELALSGLLLTVGGAALAAGRRRGDRNEGPASD